MTTTPTEEGQKNSSIYGGWNAAGHFSIQLVKRIDDISQCMCTNNIDQWILSLETFQTITHPFIDEDKSKTNWDTLNIIRNRFAAIRNERKVDLLTKQTLHRELVTVTKESFGAAAHLIWSRKEDSNISELDFVSD